MNQSYHTKSTAIWWLCTKPPTARPDGLPIKGQSTAHQRSNRKPAARRVFCACEMRCADPLPTYWVRCDRCSECRRNGFLLMFSVERRENSLFGGNRLRFSGTKKPQLSLGFGVQEVFLAARALAARRFRIASISSAVSSKLSSSLVVSLSGALKKK